MKSRKDSRLPCSTSSMASNTVLLENLLPLLGQRKLNRHCTCLTTTRRTTTKPNTLSVVQYVRPKSTAEHGKVKATKRHRGHQECHHPERNRFVAITWLLALTNHTGMKLADVRAFAVVSRMHLGNWLVSVI